jgi:hypothetical protein
MNKLQYFRDTLDNFLCENKLCIMDLELIYTKNQIFNDIGRIIKYAMYIDDLNNNKEYTLEEFLDYFIMVKSVKYKNGHGDISKSALNHAQELNYFEDHRIEYLNNTIFPAVSTNLQFENSVKQLLLNLKEQLDKTRG